MLPARSDPVPGRLVVEVIDRGGPAGERFAPDAGPVGTHCAPTTASADLTLDAATLGSVYLDGYPVRTPAAAGLIDEHAPGGLDRADAASHGYVARRSDDAGSGRSLTGL